MIGRVQAIIRTRHFKRRIRQTYPAMIIVTLVTLIFMLIAHAAHAGVNKDLSRGETLEDWQAMICGPDAADVWSVNQLERNPHTGSGTLQPAGLWAGGWLDVPDRPPLLQNLRTHPERALQTRVTDPDPTPPQVSLPSTLGMLLSGLALIFLVHAAIRRAS